MLFSYRECDGFSAINIVFQVDACDVGEQWKKKCSILSSIPELHRVKSTVYIYRQPKTLMLIHYITSLSKNSNFTLLEVIYILIFWWFYTAILQVLFIILYISLLTNNKNFTISTLINLEFHIRKIYLICQ